MLEKHHKLIITGAAGLVGQNLTLLLSEQGYSHLIAIDKNPENLAILKKINPKVQIIIADLAEPGCWGQYFENAQAVIMLHAQITGLNKTPFERNNITATHYVINAIKQYQIPYCVHVSSSVINSVANDDYTNTKKTQEKLVIDSQIPCCILRPTLMFGWFDPKHFGWLARFMERMPIFPIPGHGRYLRQPLYSRDFCRVILAALEEKPLNQIYDIVGHEQINYIDIIKTIKKIKKLNTKIIKIPYSLFYLLLKVYALWNHKPPFTANQLSALTAGDFFTGIDIQQIFNITPTPLLKALDETFNHPQYKNILVNPTE